MKFMLSLPIKGAMVILTLQNYTVGIAHKAKSTLMESENY